MKIEIFKKLIKSIFFVVAVLGLFYNSFSQAASSGVYAAKARKHFENVDFGTFYQEDDYFKNILDPLVFDNSEKPVAVFKGRISLGYTFKVFKVNTVNSF